ncbi:MAG: hypothetical protein JXM69_12990 [Anaerolineae bacterium]|nr:hypothetical protein [Anaerolineae bacterium]
MMNSLADTLTVLGPDLPPALISPENLVNIAAVAQYLPGAITTFFGFECALGDEMPRADFLTRTTANEVGVSILAGHNASAALPDSWQTHPIWQRIHAFCQNWASPASPLHGQVNNIWLEFDVPSLSYEERGLRGEIPLPSCFFGPKDCNQATAQKFQNSGVAAALQLLQNQALPPPIETNLLRCLAQLPAEASVFQVGMMLARPTEAIRLCIWDITPAEIPIYLTQLGWPGSTGDLAALISTLSGFVDIIMLDLDVGPAVLPKIGLECYFNTYRQPAREPRWPRFLAHLVETGLCCPAKRDGLLAYPGWVQPDSRQANWPDHLAPSPLLAGCYQTVFIRGVHHIKIVYQPGQPCQAKAYLYVGQMWLPNQPERVSDAGFRHSS